MLPALTFLVPIYTNASLGVPVWVYTIAKIARGHSLLSDIDEDCMDTRMYRIQPAYEVRSPLNFRSSAVQGFQIINWMSSPDKWQVAPQAGIATLRARLPDYQIETRPTKQDRRRVHKVP